VSQELKPQEQVNEAEPAALVRRDGHTADASAFSEGTEEVRVVNVRLPEEMLAEVDALRKQRRVRVSRNTWFLEAIVEKAQREQA
jgi:hypothetical protein